MPEYIYAFLAGCSVYYFNVSKDLKNKIAWLGYMMVCVVLCFCMKSGEIALFFTVSLGMLITCSQKKLNEWVYPANKVFTPINCFRNIVCALFDTSVYWIWNYSDDGATWIG